MTSDERNELARLKGLLFGDNGVKGVLPTLRDDVKALNRKVDPLVEFVAGQKALAEEQSRVTNREAVVVARARLKVDMDNAKWAAVGVVGGLAVPILLGWLGVGW